MVWAGKAASSLPSHPSWAGCGQTWPTSLCLLRFCRKLTLFNYTCHVKEGTNQ